MRFRVIDLSLSIIATLRQTLAPVRTRDSKLEKQIRTAASSIALNLAEGNRRRGRDRLHFFDIAAGSADEVATALRVAAAWGYVRQRDMAPVLDQLDHLQAVLWKLRK